MYKNNKFNFNQDKTVHAILFILDKLGGKSDFHKIFKILYFADQKQLVEFGMPITGDWYVAMQNGPVPSKTYDILKLLRGDESVLGSFKLDCSDCFEVENNKELIAKKKFDISELAESNIEFLLESIEENKDLTFDELTEKSHGKAWEKADNNEMSFIDIAIDCQAHEEILKYINLNLENQSTRFQYAVR
jgi:uncharacterized phage-associated protein